MKAVLNESDSGRALDLSDVGEKLELVFKQYPAASRRCDYCAREISPILQQLGTEIK